MPELDEHNQLVEVIEVVIVACDAIAMADDTGRLVVLETIQKVLFAESARELREGARLDFGEDSSPAWAGTLITVGYSPCHRASSHLADCGIRT